MIISEVAHVGGTANAVAAALSFLERWAPLVAYLALTPWAVALARWLRRGVSIASVKQVELGLGVPGLTVALDGVVIARNGSSIVSDMQLVLTGLDSGITHKFAWALSRRHSFKSSAGAAGVQTVPDASMETAKPFVVPSEGIVGFNMLFMARDLVQPTELILSKIANEWSSFLQQNPGLVATLSIGTTGPSPVFVAFQQTQSYRDALTDLQRGLSAWQPGRYKVTLEVRRFGSNRRTVRRWDFVLDASAIATLSSNLEPLLRNACSQLPPTWVWSYAFADLSPAS